jgi:DNA-binding NarL/FixJ family response regulator
LLSILIDRLLTTQIGVTPSGQTDLSPRERQVLELIMKAYSNREIGAELGIEERTVKAYVASLMRKTGVENRVALSVAATHEQRSQAH